LKVEKKEGEKVNKVEKSRTEYFRQLQLLDYK